jgi:hypothetical protein
MIVVHGDRRCADAVLRVICSGSSARRTLSLSTSARPAPALYQLSIADQFIRRGEARW